MSRGRLWLVAGVAGVVAALIATPVLLRHIDFFRVRQVELIGVRYHVPEHVLEELALGPDRNVFEPTAEVVRRAKAIPGVVNATVERRLPGMLRVTVEEQEPVAFAPTPGGLVALDANAKPLPYDPAATGLDLPLVPRADPVLTETLSVIGATDRALFRVLDAAQRGPGNGVVLELGRRQVMLPGVPTSNDIRALGAVRRHLGATGRSFDQLDARFAGWVVVRRSRA